MRTPVDDRARERIDALAQRHELPAGATALLEAYVRRLNWDAGNLLPQTAPELPEPNQELSEPEAHRAGRMLGEALSALDFEPVRGARRLADIGTGAGFPGLVLAIALPRTRVSLVESDAGRSAFLRNVRAVLRLDNVEVVGCPLQSWAEGVGTCDVVTSRRVWRAHTIIEHVAPLLVPRGVTVRFQKDQNPAKVALARGAAEAHGMRLERVHPATAASRNGTVRLGNRNLYLFKKVS